MFQTETLRGTVKRVIQRYGGQKQKNQPKKLKEAICGEMDTAE